MPYCRNTCTNNHCKQELALTRSRIVTFAAKETKSKRLYYLNVEDQDAKVRDGPANQISSAGTQSTLKHATPTSAPSALLEAPEIFDEFNIEHDIDGANHNGAEAGLRDVVE